MTFLLLLVSYYLRVFIFQTCMKPNILNIRYLKIDENKYYVLRIQSLLLYIKIGVLKKKGR